VNDYMFRPDDGRTKVKRPKHVVIHLILYCIINFVVFDLYILCVI